MGISASTLFAGESELAGLCREFDWSATPLGPVETWPPTLRVAAQLVLGSGIPHVVLWGPELVHIYNDPYAELIRGKHPSALGRGNLEIWPEVAHINTPIYERVFRGETVTREDALYPLERSGELEEVYLTISYSPIRDEVGTVGGVLATMVETTADVEMRQLQEEQVRLHREVALQRERLATVFQQAPAFIATLRGPDHVFEMANDGYRKLVSGRDVVGLSVREALPEVVEQGFIEVLDRVFHTGEPFIGDEVPILLRGPGAGMEERFLNFVYQPMRNADGEVEGVLVHGVDITDMVRAQHTLADQARELETRAREAEEARAQAETARAEAARANAAKSQFLATISHELRTPLNAILGYTDLLSAGVPHTLRDETLAHIRRIALSGRHLRDLIDEILTFSRLEAGEERIIREEVDVREVMDEVHALALPLARESHLRLDLRVPDSLPGLRSDPRKIRQILLNLAGNAIKFTHAGTVTLEVEPGDDDLRFHVRDTGPGIAAEHAERIFEPFWQVDGGITRSAGGTGLGLGVARRLARLLGGDVRVESRPGEGSTFTLALPRDAGPPETGEYESGEYDPAE